MRFKLGDRVLFLDETGHGEVVAVLEGNNFLIKDNDGFERKYAERKLVSLVSNEYTYSNDQMNRKIHEAQKPLKSVAQKREKSIFKIDLHIEELIDDHCRMSNGEILNLQMNFFKKFFRKAINQKAHKIVVIHGVGEGVLRSEIRHYLNQFEYEYCDADYAKYGRGGTEIFIQHSSR